MAEVKPNVDTNRKRLADIIPIEAPFTVYIEQTRVCNLKCFYCIHATRDEKDGAFNKLGYDVKHMDFDDYVKVINDLSEFPQGSIKKICYSGLGEPLANPSLPEMVKLAVDKNIAARVEIITNGLLLTPELIDKLIDAGVTAINVSVQGNSAEAYKKIAGKNINFDELLKNLEYLYKNKKDTTVYIKAVDATLNGKDDEDRFYEIFTPYADRIFIESLVQMQQNHDNIKGSVDATTNFYGEVVTSIRKVCNQAFYFLQIGCDLDTFPCPNPGLPLSLSMGSIKEHSVLDIWNGQKRHEFLKKMLMKKREEIPYCKDCNTFNCISDPAENLDDDAERLVPFFEKEL